MVSSRPQTPQGDQSPSGDSSDVASIQQDEKFQDASESHEELERPQESKLEDTKPEENKPADTTPEEPSATRVILLMISVFLCMFLVALDRTIISTAIPQITNDFNSFSDVGWYGSAYLLTCSAFQLLFGKLYTVFPVKAVYLGSLFLFEVASALCGAAPNSTAFIVGRAISGVGAAGIFSGTMVCIIYSVPLKRRPNIQGLFGALFGFASVVGPLLGGAFTSKVTWRWCFYINLPLGGVAAIVIFFFLSVPDRDTTKISLKEKLLQLDFPGTAFLVPGVVCLLLALQWGGQTFPWSDARIIALLVLTGVLLIGFVAVQILLPNTATIPPRLFKQRSVVAAFWQTLCIGSGNYIFVYFLPIWFQAIQGVNAVDSGIRLLPLMMSMVFGSLSGGFITPKIGYYTPFAIVGTAIMSIGAGLLTTFQVDSGEGMWIGYQVLYGVGLGWCFQVPNLAVQTVLSNKDAKIGLTLMLFGTLLGSAVFVSVGENVLGNQLVQRLAGIPGFHSKLITSGGATTLIGTLPSHLQMMVIAAYNEALRKVFQVGLIVSCLTVLGAASLEWKSILKKKEENVGGEKGGSSPAKK